MTPLQERIAVVQRAKEKWSWYPAVKAAARELLGNGINLEASSIQPLVFGGTKDALFSLPGVSSPATPETARRGWVNASAPILAWSRIRRQGTQEWLTNAEFCRKYNVIAPPEDRHPREYATCFWLARF